MIDPTTATVADVQDYLDQHPEDLEAVQAAEAQGQARKGIMEYDPTPPPEVFLPAGAEVVKDTPSGQWLRLEEGGEPVLVDGQEVRVRTPKPKVAL